jgi:large subunit ribosomal protein L4
MAEQKKKIESKPRTKTISKSAKPEVKKNPVKAEVKVMPTVRTKKEAQVGVKEAPKTMRNRSGLHTINPRRTGVKEAGVTVKVAVTGVDGVSKGNISLSSEVFGQKPNKTLIAQAVRVYLANQRQGTASTKTRSEVVGSTRKIYRQKGTGRARHGAIKAPIFVGGGIAFGPHPRDFSLSMPAKMKRIALISALSEKAQGGLVRVIDGDFSGKTKEVAKLMTSLECTKKGKVDKVLFVIDNNANAKKGAHNLDGLALENVATLSTYEVVVSKNIIFLKNAVEEITKRLAKN